MERNASMDSMQPENANQVADGAEIPPRGSSSLQQVAADAAPCAVSTSRRRGILWGVLAVITCPCHLPVFAVLLSGTALGVLIQENFAVTLGLLLVLFLLSVRAAMRALSSAGSNSD